MTTRAPAAAGDEGVDDDESWLDRLSERLSPYLSRIFNRAAAARRGGRRERDARILRGAICPPRVREALWIAHDALERLRRGGGDSGASPSTSSSRATLLSVHPEELSDFWRRVAMRDYGYMEDGGGGGGAGCFGSMDLVLLKDAVDERGFIEAVASDIATSLTLSALASERYARYLREGPPLPGVLGFPEYDGAERSKSFAVPWDRRATSNQRDRFRSYNDGERDGDSARGSAAVAVRPRNPYRRRRQSLRSQSGAPDDALHPLLFV